MSDQEAQLWMWIYGFVAGLAAGVLLCFVASVVM